MPLDVERKILLHLAGTVALPSPPPSGASVEILPPPDHGNTPEETYLRLTRHISHTVMIRWTVPLRHVSALAAPLESFPPDSAIESWPFGDGWVIRTSKEVMRLVGKKIAGVKAGAAESLPWMAEAVIFVPEATPVLRQAESGLTAAESVEYFTATATGVGGGHAMSLGPCAVLGLSMGVCRPIECRPVDYSRSHGGVRG